MNDFDFYNYYFFRNQSLLTEGRFIKFPNYGQIIFLVGGAGSGKNFILQNVLGYNGVNCDVDDLKTYISRELKFRDEKYKNKGNEFLKDMDFKNPNDVFRMHKFSKKIFEPENSEMGNTVIDGLLKSARTNKSKKSLANVVLNITGKDVSDFAKYAKAFVQAGYSPENIHIVWVLTPFSEALQNNSKRDRVVPEEVLRKTHAGVKKVMDTLRKSSNAVSYSEKGETKNFNMRQFINGLVMIVFNSKGVDSWIPNSRTNPNEKEFNVVTRGANEEGKNEPKGIRYTYHGKTVEEDKSEGSLTKNPSMVDHVNKVIIKEVGKPYKSDEEINKELQNAKKWLSFQQSDEFHPRKKFIKKSQRRKQTGGKTNTIDSIDDFKNKIQSYTNFQ